MNATSIDLFSDKSNIDQHGYELSNILSLEFKDQKEILKDSLYLLYDTYGLSLNYSNMKIKADFLANKKRFSKNNLLSEMIVKAAKIKGIDHTPIVIDATAGFGDDSILLAASGYKVYMYEYNTIIYSLLYDAIYRAKQDQFFNDIINKVTLINDDSIIAMKNLKFTPDIVYLDPMFPTRDKSSLIKKKFQLLQLLELPCNNENRLIESAIATGAKKIIIKRPIKGDTLGQIKPSYSYKGKSIRYDCITL